MIRQPVACSVSLPSVLVRKNGERLSVARRAGGPRTSTRDRAALYCRSEYASLRFRLVLVFETVGVSVDLRSSGLTTRMPTKRQTRARDGDLPALPGAEHKDQGDHSIYRVRGKVFAYFLDNHHGDGIVSVCVKSQRGENARPGAARAGALLSARLHWAARLVRDAARPRPRALARGRRDHRAQLPADGAEVSDQEARWRLSLPTANLAQAENCSCIFAAGMPQSRALGGPRPHNRCLKGDNNGVVGLVHFWRGASRRRIACRRRAVLPRVCRSRRGPRRPARARRTRAAASGPMVLVCRARGHGDVHAAPADLRQAHEQAVRQRQHRPRSARGPQPGARAGQDLPHRVPRQRLDGAQRRRSS